MFFRKLFGLGWSLLVVPQSPPQPTFRQKRKKKKRKVDPLIQQFDRNLQGLTDVLSQSLTLGPIL